jgi:hypothetical protein
LFVKAPVLHERTLGEGSQVRVHFQTGHCSRRPDFKILVIRYVGSYGFGSAGNGDATYMAAMAQAGMDVFQPWGVIHDLSELEYEWGDALAEVLAAKPQAVSATSALIAWIFDLPEAAARPAVVVGPGCEEAVRTLMLGADSDEPVEAIGNVFRDLASAWAFIESKVP